MDVGLSQAFTHLCLAFVALKKSEIIEGDDSPYDILRA